MKKKISITLFAFLSISFLFSQVVNDSQLLKSDNWIYSAMETLALDSQTPVFFDTRPMSVGEIKYCLSQFDYEKLSESGKILYQQVQKYLNTTKYLGKNSQLGMFPDDSITRLSVGLNLNPEFYARTNKNIPTTINYFYKDWSFTLPAIFGISDYVTIQFDYFRGKNYESSRDPDAYTNYPLEDKESEYEYPRFAYGNASAVFDKWGFSATIGKEGYSIGETKLGSIIYNSTFETDAYSVLSAYAPNFKYNLIFSQVDYKKFLYFHNFNFKFFDNLKIGFTEGCLRNGPIELRFLNPAMILHSFYSAYTYAEDTQEKYDLGNHYCSYMGITVDYYPIENLRLYALWAQTEMQLKGELSSSHGKMLPDGYGLQAGIDLTLPARDVGFFDFNIEGIYTTPYLYVKQSPEWSMIKFRKDVKHSDDVISWLGTPYGPDAIVLTVNGKYTEAQKFSVGIENLFAMKGEVDGNTLLTTDVSKYESSGQLYPSYYPSVAHSLGQLSESEAISKARDKSLSGIIQYRNDIIISGEYYFSSKIRASAEGIYTLIFNNNHKENDFQQGFELKLSLGIQLL